MKTIDLTNIYLKTGLYTEIDLSTYSQKQIINILFYDELEYNEAPTLNCFCKECNQKLSFSAYNSESGLSRLRDTNILYNDTHHESALLKINSFYSKLSTFQIFTRSFKCPNVKDNSHDVTFIFKISNQKLYKIGQYPSYNDLNTFDLQKIRKFKPNIYPELNKAMGLFSHGIGVGSYVYLRRVLEKHIVNPKFAEKIKSEENPNDYNNYYFQDKVKFLGNDISEFLATNTTLYGFISKGLHELEEQECLKLFALVYETIIMILEEEIEIEERKRKKLEIQKQLNKL